MSLFQKPIQPLVETYIHILAVVLIVFVYLDLPIYLSIAHSGLQPKYFYYLEGLLISPILLIRLRYLRLYGRSYYVFWMSLLIALNMFHYVFMETYSGGVGRSITSTRIQYLILAILIVFLLRQLRPRTLAWMFVGTAGLLVMLQLFDFLNPGRLLPLDTPGLIPGRAASTLINANKPGESLILMMIMGIAALKKNRRLIFVFVVYAGIFVSLSRGNTLVWFLFVVMSLAVGLLPRGKTAIILFSGLAAIIIFAGVLLPIIMSHVDVAAQKNVIARLSFFATRDIGDSSTQSRLGVALAGLRVFLEAPIWGHGAGYTYFWNVAEISTHNEHILFLVEYGLIGYALFLYLFILIERSGNYFKELNSEILKNLIIPILFLLGFFTHNMFDSLYWLITFGVITGKGYYESSMRY